MVPSCKLNCGVQERSLCEYIYLCRHPLILALAGLVSVNHI